MSSFTINDEDSLNELNEAFKNNEIGNVTFASPLAIEAIYQDSPIKVNISPDYVTSIKYNRDALDDLIWGKNPTTNIVNISYKDENIHLFTEKNGIIQESKIPYIHYSVSERMYFNSVRLKGQTEYKYFNEYSNYEEFLSNSSRFYATKEFKPMNPVEGFMMLHGYSYFKGMKQNELSVLGFDIETASFSPEHPNAKVLLITNAFYKNGHLTNKTFNVDTYTDDSEMIKDWAKWVCEVNPSIIIGHNIYTFDIPYLLMRCPKLPLGRDGSFLRVEDKVLKKRKDGSQSYDYRRPLIFGREIVDTLFLVITADVKRQFESYALKNLIRELGQEKPGRTLVDAGKIGENWHNPEIKALIIKYAEEDAEDTLKIYNHFSSPFFYFTAHIPKTFQNMMESATGSQINSFLIRSYLQNGHSIPKATPGGEDDEDRVEGGISFGVPGIYKNLVKIDLKSAYPSQVLRFKMFNKTKDPQGHFYRMVEYFALKRFDYKKLGNETGDKYYKDMDDSAKIFINSAYGLCNTGGIHFNDPEMAAKITKETREVIDQALRWASGKSYHYWIQEFYEKVSKKEEERTTLTVDSSLPVEKSYNYIIGPTDTDSISFTKADGAAFSKEEIKEHLKEINDICPDFMIFEDDGYYDKCISLKAKNYILRKTVNGETKTTYKGSAIKSSKIEPILKRLMKDIIEDMLENDAKEVKNIYHKYILEAKNPTNIKDWLQKKTVTKAVLFPSTTTGANIQKAIGDRNVQEGDKVYLYPALFSEEKIVSYTKAGKEKVKVIRHTGLKHVDDYANDYDSEKLIDRVVATVQLFVYILGKDYFTDYTLVKNKKLLEELSHESGR